MLTKAVVWLQFGYQDTTHQLPGGSARQGPDAASLLVRGLYGAGPMPSYSGQPAAEGGHLFQDLGLLALPREKAARMDPASTRPVHGVRLPGDYRDVGQRDQATPVAARPSSAQTGTHPLGLGLSVPFALYPPKPQPMAPLGCRALTKCHIPLQMPP